MTTLHPLSATIRLTLALSALGLASTTTAAPATSTATSTDLSAGYVASATVATLDAIEVTGARRREEEAQDVAQDTLLAVAKSMPDFHYDPARSSFKTWPGCTALMNMA